MKCVEGERGGLGAGGGGGPGRGPPGAFPRRKGMVKPQGRSGRPLLGLDIRFLITWDAGVASNPVDADLDDPLKVIHRLSCPAGESFVCGRAPATAEVADNSRRVREEKSIVPLEAAVLNPGMNEPGERPESLRLAHIVVCLAKRDGTRMEGYPPLFDHKARTRVARISKGRAV